MYVRHSRLIKRVQGSSSYSFDMRATHTHTHTHTYYIVLATLRSSNYINFTPAHYKNSRQIYPTEAYLGSWRCVNCYLRVWAGTPWLDSQ